MKKGRTLTPYERRSPFPNQDINHCAGSLLATHAWIIAINSFPCVSAVSVSVCNYRLTVGLLQIRPWQDSQRRQQDHVITQRVSVMSLIPSPLHTDVQSTERGLASVSVTLFKAIVCRSGFVLKKTSQVTKITLLVNGKRNLNLYLCLRRMKVWRYSSIQS